MYITCSSLICHCAMKKDNFLRNTCDEVGKGTYYKNKRMT